MKLGKLILMPALAGLVMPVMAVETAAQADDIQAYCDEQADAAGLDATDPARAGFVKMCVESETASAAAEGQGGSD